MRGSKEQDMKMRDEVKIYGGNEREKPSSLSFISSEIYRRWFFINVLFIM